MSINEKMIDGGMFSPVWEDMKKVLGCLMAAITLFGGALATISCGGGGDGKDGDSSSSTIASIDENKVTLKFTKKVYNKQCKQ